MRLVDLPIAACARVSVLRLDDAEAAHVRAIGVFEDEVVMVLRRAPFGGPVHVRTSSGGEFALCARIAEKIDVKVEELGEAAE
jgi:ferrous iron transport protein A